LALAASAVAAHSRRLLSDIHLLRWTPTCRYIDFDFDRLLYNRYCRPVNPIAPVQRVSAVLHRLARGGVGATRVRDANRGTCFNPPSPWVAVFAAQYGVARTTGLAGGVSSQNAPREKAAPVVANQNRTSALQVLYTTLFHHRKRQPNTT